MLKRTVVSTVAILAALFGTRERARTASRSPLAVRSGARSSSISGRPAAALAARDCRIDQRSSVSMASPAGTSADTTVQGPVEDRVSASSLRPSSCSAS
jgi:hypothetical protein